MFNNNSLIFVSLLGTALVSSCSVGEIGDGAGETRFGPESGLQPEEPFAPACSSTLPDLSASDGWRTTQASQAALDTLRFEFMARPAAANLNGLVAVGAQNIDEFSDAAISVRFTGSGLIDARDGSTYASDRFFAYDPGVWYQISISANIAARTYDVAVGRCGEPTQALITGAAFRSDASVSNQLKTWALWSSQSAVIELSTPMWTASGSCAPATCQSLGFECGQRSDGCNGTLSCGDCGGAEICSSGVCIDAPVSVPSPAPPQDVGVDGGQPAGSGVEVVPPVDGSAHPNMFLNSTEIAAITAKIHAGQEPWKSAHGSLISRANDYLTAGTVSVTQGGTVGPSGDPHIFATGNGYGGERVDYQAAHTLQKAVRTLALAYSFTGHDKYADKAVQYIYDWTTNPATRMRPDVLEGLQNAAQPRLDCSITLPGVYYGADLIWNYPGWRASDKAAFVDWVETLMNSYYRPGHGQCGNNWQDWKHLMYAASAVILEDETYLEDAFTLFKEALPCKMNDDGRMEREYTRGGDGGISYTLFSLNPMLQIAEIARHHGEDLYSFKSGLKSLERGMDFITPYCVNPSSWPWDVGNWRPGGTDGVGAFELINFYKQKSTYMDFVDKSGRPLFDIWITGDVTLTHASGAFPFKVWN